LSFSERVAVTLSASIALLQDLYFYHLPDFYGLPALRASERVLIFLFARRGTSSMAKRCLALSSFAKELA
jgi:hypothetical protein